MLENGKYNNKSMKKSTKNLSVAMVAILFATTIVKAQAPQAIPYQAAARNSKGVVIAFKTIGLRFTVLDTVSGARQIVYQETMPATTNALGLFMVNIGLGQPVSGSFSGINWGATANMYIQVELDTFGYRGNDPNSSSYVVIGTQQLMSVPYALYANYATLAGNGVPVGTIEAFAGDISKKPDGWALCDGSSHGINEPLYSNLFNVIGYAWGNPSNGQFQLPFTLGVFLRGQAHGSGWDPDRDNRTAIYPNGNKNDNVGSAQWNTYTSHNHGVSDPGHSHSVTSTYGFSSFVGCYAMSGGDCSNATYYPILQNTAMQSNNSTTGLTVNPNGGNETRPNNVYVNYIIKL